MIALSVILMPAGQTSVQHLVLLPQAQARPFWTGAAPAGPGPQPRTMLFLTASPVLAGRAGTPRPVLAAGRELLPGRAERTDLLSARQRQVRVCPEP
jgi:hypothetical protein